MKMTRPELRVVRFREEDVIVASGAPALSSVALDGYRNGTVGDATLTVGETVFNKTNPGNYSAVLSALQGAGLPSDATVDDTYFSWGSSSRALTTFWSFMVAGQDENAVFNDANGSYRYQGPDDGNYIFNKIVP